jgi:hypothetical protein
MHGVFHELVRPVGEREAFDLGLSVGLECVHDPDLWWQLRGRALYIGRAPSKRPCSVTYLVDARARGEFLEYVDK